VKEPVTPFGDQVARVGSNVCGAALRPGRRGALGELTRPREHCIEHGLGEPAREGVLLARVVRAHDRHARGVDLGQMREPRTSTRKLDAGVAQHPPEGLVTEAAQRDQDAGVFEQTELAGHERRAAVPLCRRRAVGRRCAAHRGTHVRVGQRQPVVPVSRLCLICEPGAKERPVEPLAGAITGEHAPGPVRAVRGRCQTDHDDAGVRVSETWDRPTPVLLVTVGRSSLPRDLLTPRNESRARSTARDLVAEACKAGTTASAHPGDATLSPVRVLLIVNAIASSVTAQKRAVIETALRADHDLDIVETSDRGHAGKLSADAAAREVDVVAVLAGDGTLNEAANGLAGTETALAPLPGGSTNVYVRTIGVARDAVDATAQLLESLSARSTRRVGLGIANDRHFLFHVGVGFDAAVVERVERRHRLKRYVGHPLFATAAVATWVREYDHGHPRFRVELPGEETIEGGIFAIVSKTSPYTFFGSRRIQVSPETGLDTALGLTVIRTRHTPTFLALAGSALASGRMLRRNPSTVHRVNLDRLAIVGLGAFPWQADGEFLGLTERLDLSYDPTALNLVVPVPGPTP